MSLLQNKWAVAALAVGAVGVLVYQFLPKTPTPATGRSRTEARPATATPARSGTGTARATGGAAGTPAAAAPKRPRQPADRDYLASRFREWRESAPRDPFELFPEARTSTVDPPVYAVDLLSLTAVWRQTGSRLAVVNSRVVGERDVIEGFEVHSIGGDHIWVNGPNGRELVEFGNRPARSMTNQVAGAARPRAR